MKKKINIHFIIIAVLAIVMSTVLSTIVSYTVLKKEVIDDLQAYAYALKGTGVFEDVEQIHYISQTDKLRITLIAENGAVIFDTNADITSMDNHEGRAEIEQSRKKGTGQSVRLSNTLGKNTFYYAILLDNGYVLRVAKEASNIISVFFSSLPFIVGIVVILVLVCVLLAHFLTKSIVAPIEKMAQNIDDKEVECVYKELRPFVSMIQKQHDNIVKVADMRQEFTANISHELKTPLTSISGYAELIENGMATDEDVIRFAGEIHQNANRLLILINDIIRLSELDVSTEEAVQFELLDLYPLAQNCVDMLQVNAENHQVRITLQGESCQISANREMMNELLFNLCDNAIRYNNQGGSVSVRVFHGPLGEGCLEVVDTGIGIPKEHQERIFERFYRVDKSRSKSTGGTGLGLAIVKHIIVQNHARLELESEQGKGTRICVIFPAVEE
ncbi:MAG: two-component sensor histidine kinase [Lachnospiraceae bacterium]|nr:two-component sensor histidine kinase [Lachnospiraceae bacterium]